MLDATEHFIQKAKKEKVEFEQFSFKYLAKKAVERQNNDKDTIVIVIGERRNGKSNWGLNLISAFINKRREEDEFKWSWKENFPLTRSEAMEKAEKVSNKSFIFYDEGADFMYRGDTLSHMNKTLIKFMTKSGKKKLLTVIVLPDIYLLDPKILNMAHFLVAVPYRYEKICSFAFIYSRNPNPFVQDKFGLEIIKRQFASRKLRKGLRSPTMDGKMKVMHKTKTIVIPYPKELFAFLRSLPTYVHWHRFKATNKNFEKRYIKNVKDPQLAIADDFNFVKESDFRKIYEQRETLLYNLRYNMGLSYMQMERLHRNSDGKSILTNTTIKKIIEAKEIKENQQTVTNVRGIDATRN